MGGPAGLYFAISTKLRDPAHRITALERNRAWAMPQRRGILPSARARDLRSTAPSHWADYLYSETTLQAAFARYQKVHAAWGAHKPLSVRISANDWADPSGITPIEARAIARMSRDAGAGGGRSAEVLAAAEHRAIGGVQADVTDEAAVRDMFANAGPCDIVGANAGAADSGVPARTSLDQWNAMNALNLTGTFLTLREGIRQIPGWGRLLAVGAPCAAAKHGVVGMIRALAPEIARSPVTANAICPGFLEAPMTDHAIGAIAGKTGRTRAEARRTLEAPSPQDRLIAPAEVTACALWLGAPGSEGGNGQAIVLNGGAA